MTRLKDNATFEEFLEILVDDEALRKSYEGNNYVHKITLVLDHGQERKLKYVFETQPGFCQDQRYRSGTIDMKME